MNGTTAEMLHSYLDEYTGGGEAAQEVLSEDELHVADTVGTTAITGDQSVPAPLIEFAFDDDGNMLSKLPNQNMEIIAKVEPNPSTSKAEETLTAGKKRKRPAVAAQRLPQSVTAMNNLAQQAC
ncbi:hypothetical protein ILUMI_05738 [Ignelater luminosus]|uniref:Uncharacterized protein n=1 Tax=Ignelater luminosus TaxID=2038154 RepID=A0A8K0D6Q7_IGNLU|nr:hypothetical protein ILUMI_05738 [Ignelater luminosus]